MIGMITRNIKFNLQQYIKSTHPFSSKLLFPYTINVEKNKNYSKFSSSSKKSNDSSMKKDSTEDDDISQNNNKHKDSQDDELEQVEDFLFNKLGQYEKNYKIKNQLILRKDKYQKSKRELKEAILFEDLLKNQLNIVVYTTNGKPFFHEFLKFVIVSAFLAVSYFIWKYVLTNDSKVKLLVGSTEEGKVFIALIIIICSVIAFKMIANYCKFTKRYVESLIYNTENQNFTFTQRRYWGTKYSYEVSRFKILYTENSQLNKRGTNYLNIDNKAEYNIGYAYAWKKQDLFSHLISQRIRK